MAAPRKQYQVVAPYITVLSATADGPRLIGLYRDHVLPDDVPQKQIDDHLACGLIRELDGPAPAPAEPAGDDLDDPAPAPAEPAGDDPDITPTRQAGVEPDPDPEAPGRPPESGPGSGKSAWVEYAVACGMDADEAAAMSRDEIIAAFPARV